MRDPYKVNQLVAMLKELKEDKWFTPQCTAPGKANIKPINLDEGAIRKLITYYGG